MSEWDGLDDPGLFLAMEDLELAAQGIVEGALHGLHRSPFRGFGAEFDSHREYQQGDDLRYLDWNLYARHGRPFTKQFRADTNLNLYLLLDSSASMAMAQGPTAKFRYAARAAAALALLTRRTRDAPGLYLLRASGVEALPPATRRGHLEDLFASLEAAAPAGPGDLAAALETILATCRRRGIVIVFSDFLDPEETLLRGLRSLRHAGHEVIVFQTLDPWEVELSANGDFEFADLETGTVVRTSSPDIRAGYARAVAEWRERLQRECEGAGLAWVSAITTDPLIQVITRFLSLRAGR